MVTVKGTEISDQLALDSIKAMERLVYFYKHPDEIKRCPLCNFREGPFLPGEADKYCRKCPWLVLKGYSCTNSLFSMVNYDPQRKYNRIRQLRRWIKIYQKALEAK